MSEDTGYLYLGQAFDSNDRVDGMNVYTKIGITQDPPQRLQELNRTNSPFGYRIVDLWKTHQFKDVEDHLHKVHDLVTSSTGGSSEWTETPYDEIVDIIQSLQRFVNMEKVDVASLQEAGRAYKKYTTNSKELVEMMKTFWQKHVDDFSEKYTEQTFDVNKRDYIGSGVIKVEDEILEGVSINIQVRPKGCHIDFNDFKKVFNLDSIKSWLDSQKINYRQTSKGLVIPGQGLSNTLTIEDAHKVYMQMHQAIQNKEFTYNGLMVINNLVYYYSN